MLTFYADEAALPVGRSRLRERDRTILATTESIYKLTKIREFILAIIYSRNNVDKLITILNNLAVGIHFVRFY